MKKLLALLMLMTLGLGSLRSQEAIEQQEEFVEPTPLRELSTQEVVDQELFMAVMSNNRDLAEFLIIQKGANPNVRDVAGNTPIFAVQNLEMAKLLVEKGANPAAQNNEGISLLHIASAEGKRKLAKYLLEQKVNPNIRDTEGSTPLHYAKGLPMMRVLVKGGANVNAQSKEGLTRLHLDVLLGHIRRVRFLIRKNANVKLATRTGITPLHYATMISFFADPQRASQAKAIGSATFNIALWGAFLWPIGKKVLRKVGVIGTKAAAAAGATEAGAATGTAVTGAATAGVGTTLATVAASLAAVVVIVAIIDISIRNRIVDALLVAGADPNAKDEIGSTPLHILASGSLLKPKERHGGAWMAKRLIVDGADRTLTNAVGKTPYDIAVENKRGPHLRLALNPKIKGRFFEKGLQKARQAIVN